MCCHTEIGVADPTFHLTQSQYNDTGPTSPSADPIKPGAWQGSHWSANFEVTGMTRPGKIPSQAGFEPRVCPEAYALTTRPARWSVWRSKSQTHVPHNNPLVVSAVIHFSVDKSDPCTS